MVGILVQPVTVYRVIRAPAASRFQRGRMTIVAPQ